METDVNTHSVTSGQACNTDVPSTSQDMNTCVDKLWEMNPVNDVTMSDVTRAVNAFITDPGSSMHGRTSPKKEPDDDSTLEGLFHTSSTCTNDHTEEDLTFREEVVFPKVVNSTKHIVEYSRSLMPSTSMKREVIVCQDPNLPTAADVSNTCVDKLIGKDTLSKAVDSSSLPPRRNLRSNTSKMKACEAATKPHNLETIEINESKTTLKLSDSDDSSDSSSTVSADNDWADWLTLPLPRITQQVKCNVCGNTYDNNSLLESHLTTHPGILHFTCKIGNCKSNCTTKENLVKHTSKYHAGKPILYSIKVIMKTKNASKACKKPFICHLGPKKDCNLKFPSKRQLDKHIKTDHKSEGLYCSKCGKRFYRVFHLEQHENVHKRVKPYQCRYCGKKFHTNLEKHSHTRLKHLDQQTQVQCEICGALGSGGFLKSHMRTIHRKVRYPCKECKEVFLYPRHLKDHMRLHRGEERYKCDLCSHSFWRKDQLRGHIKRHSLRFTCPKCDKVFASKSFLRGHLLLHDGIKKYCCKICGKTFAHIHYLFTHMKSHGEKQFDCAICGGKFNRKDNLKSHIIRHQTTGRINLKKR